MCCSSRGALTIGETSSADKTPLVTACVTENEQTSVVVSTKPPLAPITAAVLQSSVSSVSVC